MIAKLLAFFFPPQVITVSTKPPINVRGDICQPGSVIEYGHGNKEFANRIISQIYRQNGRF